MLNEMRDFLSNMANSYGEMPKQFDTTSIFNQMIQDLLKMKFSNDAQKNMPGQKGNGPTQRAQSMTNAGSLAAAGQKNGVKN